MLVKPLSQTDLEANWLQEGDFALKNDKFGYVQRVAVCDDDGNPIWDQYQIYEVPGSLIVPYYLIGDEIYVGIITVLRPIVVDPKTGEQGNYKCLEVPRGFNLDPKETTLKSAKRELGEETGRHLLKITEIGQTNANTAFYGTDGIENTTWAATVDSKIQNDLNPGANEKILKCEFHTLGEVMEMLRQREIICGLTKSAIQDFVAHMRLVR